MSFVIYYLFILLGRAHLREALVLHEESQRLQRMCRELKGKHALKGVLTKAQDTTMKDYNAVGDEDDFRELLDPPNIIGKYKIDYFVFVTLV